MAVMYTLRKFPTHIAKTTNKVKEDKYWKINSQGIYNGSINRFARAIVIRNMHTYILSELGRYKIPKVTPPVILNLDVFIPINYSDIRRKKDGTLSWNFPDKEYVPTNDEDNISWIWNKCIKDCLTKLEVWPDDIMTVCRGTHSTVYFVGDIEDRRINIYFSSFPLNK